MDFLIHNLIMIGIFVCPALGFNMVFGKGKVFHFGLQAQAITAAYTIWILAARHDVHFLLAILIAAIAVSIVSLILAWLSFRLEPDGLGVMSIALHLAFLAVVLNWQSMTRGALGIPGLPRGILPTNMTAYLLVVLVVAAIWIYLILCLDRGSFGRKLAALAEQRWHAESLGINYKRVHIVAFLISGFGILISSALYPPLIYLLTPNDYNFPAFIFYVMWVIAGGPGSVWGVVISTTALMALKEALRFVPLAPAVLGPIRLMLFGLILFAAIWWRRDTLFPKERKV